MDEELEKSRQENSTETDYLDSKVNIFSPSTPFMREHLKIIWTMFAMWVIIVFGPVTATFFIPEIMTGITIWEFPLHYFLTAVGAPSGALILSVIYARKRDQLDAKYKIDHASQTAVTDTTSTEKEA